jgi:hypothetical protein
MVCSMPNAHIHDCMYMCPLRRILACLGTLFSLGRQTLFASEVFDDKAVDSNLGGRLQFHS